LNLYNLLEDITLNNLLYIGVKGTALAVDRSTGREVWRTPLKGSDFVNVVLDREELFAATKGEVFRLDPRSGAVIWHNTMTGFGWGLITFATGGQVATVREKQRREEDVSAAT